MDDEGSCFKRNSVYNQGMNEKDYIKGLEDRIEELQQKLGAVSHNLKIVVTAKMSDAFKPEKKIIVNALIRVIKGDKMTGSQVDIINIATATRKQKYWVVDHNETITYQIKKNIDNEEKIIEHILEQAGYAGAPYELVSK